MATNLYERIAEMKKPGVQSIAFAEALFNYFIILFDCHVNIQC